MTFSRNNYEYAAHVNHHGYHHYQAVDSANQRKILLLHGSRLAGIETWEPIIRNLAHWSEIIVPDLPGIGRYNPKNQSAADFSIDDVIDALAQILMSHGWGKIDIVSYSYGGLVAKKFAIKYPQFVKRQMFIESAILVQTAINIPNVGFRLAAIARQTEHDPQAGNEQFSKLVGQHSVRKFALKTNRRPIHNPLGFANVMLHLAHFCLYEDIWELMKSQPEVTCLLALPMSSGKQQLFDKIRQRLPWKIETITHADHSFIFTHPVEIAKSINRWLKG